MLKYLWVAVVVAGMDQLSKIWASSALEMFQPHALIANFNFTLMHNTGAAFSFLSDAGGWQRWFFTLLAIVVSAAIVMWMKKLPSHERVQAVGLAMILGGAIGNLIDRIAYGYVVDFLDFYYRADSCLPGFAFSRGECHWPAFNLADSAITVGAVLLIALSFKGDKHTEKSEA